jgi:hypothetical protein
MVLAALTQTMLVEGAAERAPLEIMAQMTTAVMAVLELHQVSQDRL